MSKKELILNISEQTVEGSQTKTSESDAKPYFNEYDSTTGQFLKRQK